MGSEQVGLIGLAVMGQNLVRNLQRNGIHVSIFNRDRKKTDQFLEAFPTLPNIFPMYTLEELCKSLVRPRKIILMIKAGNPVDMVIDQLLPYLEEGDIIMDGGNSWYKDTVKRLTKLSLNGIKFIGMGVSGGEEGALNGPSIMPGGSFEGWKQVKPILQSIAAQVTNIPCCQYIGSGGAGHFVKMVHNGIEYGIMQLIAETYDILRQIKTISSDNIANIFNKWNQGELESYLIEITSKIFQIVDSGTNNVLLEQILDVAEQKGTGKWTSNSALELGIATPTITDAVFARYLSAIKTTRIACSKSFAAPNRKGLFKNLDIEGIRQALYLSILVTYAQGFALLKDASKQYDWKLQFREIAQVWKGGCIIRARILDEIQKIYENDNTIEHLLLGKSLLAKFQAYQTNWRKTISKGIEIGIPVSAFASSISYYDSIRSSQLPTNLIQAQRDYFGAHTFERKDKPRGVRFHFNWVGE